MLKAGKKRVLVTGGAGFLGSHLIDRLLERGDCVICLDNLYTGSEENLRHHSSNPDFQFKLHDVIDPVELEVDQIYNLACPASPVQYQRNPIRTLKTSVFGAMNVLDLAKELDIRILQASTSEIYGDPHIHPQTEAYWGNVNPIGTRSCYDEGKRCAETLFFDYQRQHGTDIRVVRIFNTYGPRMAQDDGRVISNFIVQALLGEDITVYGDGKQTRSFCYVDDLVEGFMRFMDLEAGDANDIDSFGPVNLGNPVEFTVEDLAEQVITLTNSESNIRYMPLPADDPTMRRPDISVATNLLGGWQPEVQLSLGLQKTIQYFSERIALTR